MKKIYQQKGYLLIRNFLNDKEVSELHAVLTEFHQLWQKKNTELYQQ